MFLSNRRLSKKNFKKINKRPRRLIKVLQSYSGISSSLTCKGKKPVQKELRHRISMCSQAIFFLQIP